VYSCRTHYQYHKAAWRSLRDVRPERGDFPSSIGSRSLGATKRSEATRVLRNERTNDRSPSRACEICARVVLWLTLLMIAMCPISEQFCALDNFPRCGQDSELTLLLFISLTALVLLLGLRRRANLSDAFALWREFFAVPLNLFFRRSLCAGTIRIAWAAIKKKPDILITVPLPLRI
jgi:hypothetical protein